MDFSNAMRKARKEKHITQQQLADAVGLSVMSIRRYESRNKQVRRIPNIEDYERIQRFLEIDDNTIMSKRKKYSVSDSRIPAFTSIFRQEVEAFGGVTHFSELTSISRPTISFWYNGERTPDAESMIKLAKFLNVNVDYLLGLSKVRNRDTTVQAVCEYTGLSEKSIRLLHIMAERGYSDKIKRLDYIIAYDEFYLADV